MAGSVAMTNAKSNRLANLTVLLSEYTELTCTSLMVKLWVESFRYCQIRRSYAVSKFCDYYKALCPKGIPPQARQMIARELAETIERHGLMGDECDNEQWLRLHEWICDFDEEVAHE
jgi:hypothetical protein